MLVNRSSSNVQNIERTWLIRFIQFAAELSGASRIILHHHVVVPQGKIQHEAPK